MREGCVEAVRKLVTTYGLGATARVIEEHRDGLYDPDALELLRLQLPRHAEHTREHHVIAARLRALERSIEAGDAVTFKGYEEATDSILAILNARDWDEIRHTVEGNRHHLLPEVSDIAFADLLMQPADDETAAQVAGGWSFIRRCREMGVEAALIQEQQPRRGVVLGADVAAGLAAAGSAEEVIERFHAEPEIASRVARQQARDSQFAQWPHLAAYSSILSTLVGPDRADARIDTCRTALGSLDREQLPIVWAIIALDLADALRTRAGYAAPSPMAEVITLYRDAADRLSPEGEAPTYAHAHRYLGDALMLDAEGEPDANIEAAIAAFETALALYRPSVESADWAAVATHLGEALLRRLNGDPSVDADRAISLLEQAVELLERDEQGALLATARLSLAMALLQRVSGSRDDNLRRAARNLRNAAEGVDEDAYPDIWAMANAHLGSVFLERARGDVQHRSELLEQAEHSFRTAASRNDASARVRARAHAGLGWVLGDRGQVPDADGGPVAHLQSAIDLYRALGPALDPERASIHRNVGITYAEHSAQLDAGAVASAEQHFRAALELLPAESHAIDRRDTLRPFGMMYFEQGEWAKALWCFEQAVELSEGALSGYSTSRGKEKEVTENRGLYSPAAYCLAQLGRASEAFAVLERGKARMLAEAMAVRETSDADADTSEQGTLVWARSEIIRLEAKSRQLASTGDVESQARIAGQLQDACWHRARLRAANAADPGDELDVASLLASIPERGALVAVFATTRGGAAFVIPGGVSAVSSEHLVDLPSLDVRRVMELVAGRGGEGGWLNAYLEWLAQPGEFEAFRASLDAVSRELWEHLMAPVEARLTTLGIGRGAPVVVMPVGWLSLLPLHLAQGTSNKNGRTLAERFVVSYIPRLQMLATCRRRLRAPERHGRAALIVANPTGDLRHAGVEGAVVARLFEAGQGSVMALDGADATRARVIDNVKGRHVVHFACHARFDWADASQSGLQLAGGEDVRLHDLLSPEVDLRSARLVTLSACETGLSEFRNMPDEFVGLPGALLQGGAAAVVSSMWPVDDVSTRLLMTEFYRLLLTGRPTAMALHQAQRWLKESTAAELNVAGMYDEVYAASGKRDVDAMHSAQHHRANASEAPFAHPYYWGAFVLTGA
ncbi:MAG: CHAT domain-containing protein [Gemmatimonadaceae bacterium]